MPVDNNNTALGLGALSCSQVNAQKSRAGTIACTERLLADLETDMDKILKNDGFGRLLCLVQEPYVTTDFKVKIFTNKLQLLCSSEDSPRACNIANKKLK